MRALFILMLLIPFLHFSQTGEFNFHSPKNIKDFANHLFCEKDYMRANLEYEKLENIVDDTINFKIGLGYLYIGDYSNSIQKLSVIASVSVFFDEAKLQELKTYFLTENYTAFRSFYLESYSNKNNSYQSKGKKLFNFSYLFTDDDLPTSEKFLNPFNKGEKEKITSFYNRKNEPPNKNPVLAGIMSAIIPGSGKMYVGEWGDGIMALVTTGLFAFLAYDNFRADHNTRAWIFTGLGAFFYAGNVYGSVAAAQIYNAKIAFEFEDGLNLYLEQKNYFTPEYNFCE